MRAIDRSQAKFEASSVAMPSLRIALFSLLATAIGGLDSNLKTSARRGGEPANRRSDVPCSARIASSVSFSAVARIATAID